jgi:hypothetical protein
MEFDIYPNIKASVKKLKSLSDIHARIVNVMNQASREQQKAA